MTPTTKAGKALLDKVQRLNGRSFPLATNADIAAIEAEARAAERARITAAVEASYGVAIDAGPRWVPLAAVLAIVNPEPKEDR